MFFLLTDRAFGSIFKSMETAAIDIEKVKRFLEEKESRAEKRQRDALTRIIKNLKDLAGVWQKYKIKRVYLYGSVASGRIHDRSDIDIAVEGDLDYRGLLHLFAEVDKHMDREIDVRNLDELPFKETIRKEGVLVYEEE